MTAQKEYFIYLLSCFLSGDAPKGRETDFEELYHLADIHDVSAIVAQELKLVESEWKPTGLIASHFTQTIGLTVREYQKKEQVYSAVKKILTAAEIPHLFVKGAIIKEYYPIPEMRTSGDIDVIVKPESFDTVLNIVHANSNLMTLVEHTTNVIVVKMNGIEVEIHSSADVGSGYFENVFSLCSVSNGFTYELDDTDHLLYIICHLAKHLAYRGAGIRMLMDIDVMIRHIPNFNLEAFLLLCDKANIRKTAEALISLSVYWFHTPVQQTVDFTADSKLLESFENVILDGGSFGYEMNAIPLRYIAADNTQLTLFNKIKVLLKMAFPSREYLKKCYPYYNNHASLYPVARINRVADGLFKKRKQAEGAFRQMKTDGGTASYQLALMKELEINFEK